MTTVAELIDVLKQCRPEAIVKVRDLNGLLTHKIEVSAYADSCYNPFKHVVEIGRVSDDNHPQEVLFRDEAVARLEKEMDEAAEYINFYLQEIPLNPQAHNWLIRNGYKDESYQESFYGQEIAEL